MKIAFVIGNGESRKKVKLSTLQDHGVIYGCNQLIDEFQLDNTVVCDRSLLIDMISRGVGLRTNLWTRPRWFDTIACDHCQKLPVPFDTLDQYSRELDFGSGMHAIHLAASQGSDLIVMIGFDIWPKDINGVDPQCWAVQGKLLFDKFPDASFVQIQGKAWKDPVDWILSDNYSRDTISGLKELLKQLD